MYGVADDCSKTVQESDFVGALFSHLLNMPNLPEDLKSIKFQSSHDWASFYGKDNLTGNLRELLSNCSRNWSRLSS